MDTAVNKNINPFKGAILLKIGKKKSFSHNYDETPTLSIPFRKLFMTNFDDYKFKNEEKKFLSKRHREFILKYKGLSPEAIENNAEKFIKYLVSLKENNITIKASELGSYICLAAIFSNKLPTKLNIKFILSNTPLSLFPDCLVKNCNNLKNLSLQFDVNPKTFWACPIESVLTPPNKMKKSLKRSLTVEFTSESQTIAS